MYNRTEFYTSPDHRAADTLVGLLYLSCFLVGVPANVLSLCYFTRQRLKSMDLPTYLYTLTALQDAIISLLSLNHGITMLRYREVWLPGVCPAHHILFQMSQRMSVFLVATLSVTRTYTLIYPLKRVNPKSVLKVLAVLWVLMTCFFVLPPALKLVQITYHWKGGYCWAEPIPGKDISITWDTFDNGMDTAGLAFPVLPITLSCIVSACKIKASIPSQGSTKRFKSKSAKQRKDRTLQMFSMSIKNSNRKATFTIIIVTTLYIISNIPNFINYVLYLITITSLEYPGPIYSSAFMYFYSWNFTALLSTGLNACANPIVYITRFQRYRRWIKGGCKGEVTTGRHSMTTIPIRQSVVSFGVPRRPGRVSTTMPPILSSTGDSIVIPNMTFSVQELSPQVLIKQLYG